MAVALFKIVSKINQKCNTVMHVNFQFQICIMQTTVLDGINETTQPNEDVGIDK